MAMLAAGAEKQKVSAAAGRYHAVFNTIATQTKNGSDESAEHVEGSFRVNVFRREMTTTCSLRRELRRDAQE